MTTDPSDAMLVAMTLAGEERGFEILVRRYRRVALARARALVLEQGDADDVVQEAFIRVHDQLPLLRDPGRVGPWLMTIVRNISLNSERARRRRRAVPISPDVRVDDRDSSDQRALQGDMRAKLVDALSKISTTQREVVLLSDLEGCAHAEIARLLDISVHMSRRHLSDARAKLRVLLSSTDH